MNEDESIFMHKLGSKIKVIRTTKGLSLKSLSEKSEIPINLITEIESGLTTIFLPDFVAILRALEEKPESLFD